MTLWVVVTSLTNIRIVSLLTGVGISASQFTERSKQLKHDEKIAHWETFLCIYTNMNMKIVPCSRKRRKEQQQSGSAFLARALKEHS